MGWDALLTDIITLAINDLAKDNGSTIQMRTGIKGDKKL